MNRMRLHRLPIRLRLDCLPGQLAAEFCRYFTPDNRRSDSRPGISLLLERSAANPPPEGDFAFFHGTIRGWVEGDMVRLHDGRSLLRILPDGTIEGRIDPASFEPGQQFVHVFLFIGLVVAARWHDLFHLHAGCLVAPDGSGVLVAGDAGAGKTTLTLAMITAGWNFLGDDAVWLARAASGIEALRISRPFHLAPRTAEMFPGLAALATAGPVLSGKLAVDPAGIAGRRRIRDRVIPRSILLPSIERGPSGVATADDGAAFERLVGSGALFLIRGMPRRLQHAALMQALHRQARPLEVRLGSDLHAGAGRLARMVEEALARK